jgi:hypothetical protein
MTFPPRILARVRVDANSPSARRCGPSGGQQQQRNARAATFADASLPRRQAPLVTPIRRDVDGGAAIASAADQARVRMAQQAREFPARPRTRTSRLVGSEMFDPDQAVAYTLGLMAIAFVAWVLAR